MRRLPPLNALKAFEASARHRKFTQAALELNVTQSAVSRHVKGLEEYLGVQLFHRHARRLELTDQAIALLPVLTDSFDRIAQITSEVRAHATDLSIKLQPTFAMRWLIPRLGDFRAQRPDVRIQFSTSWRPVDFATERFDAGIVCGAAIDVYDDSISCELIVPEPLTPVCSPQLLEDAPPLRSPADLFRFTLLHSRAAEQFWRHWFAELGIPYQFERATRHQFFDLHDTAIRAAVQGLGVALANPQFIKDELALGQLAMPFKDILLDISGYYLVCANTMITQPRVMAFRDWLQTTSGMPAGADSD